MSITDDSMTQSQTQSRSTGALSWLGDKYRMAGGRRFVRRAVEIYRDGGIRRLREHWLHAGAAASREARYQIWMREIEPALLADASARARAILASAATDGDPHRADAAVAARPPRIAILLPAYETPEWMLRRCIESALAQKYVDWRLFVIDDASPSNVIEPVVLEYAERDERISIERLESNGGISAATNRALQLAAAASCDFVALLDHDDELSPFALELVAAAIMADPKIDVVYTDEDKIDERGRRRNPAFKPPLSPAYLLTCNYICHLLVARTSLARELGGLRGEFDGAQDYDLSLRLIERARRVEHLPHVLYHWRTHADSTAGFGDAKPYAIEAGRRAVAEALNRAGVESRVESGPFTLTYRPRPMIDRTLDLALALVHSTGADCGDVAEPSWRRHPLIAECMVINSDPTSNRSVIDRVLHDERSPRWLLFIDYEIEPAPGDWLERMLELAMTPRAGVVGAKIIRGDAMIDSAGLVIDDSGRLDHLYRGSAAHEPGYLWSLLGPRNVDAVDPGFMLINRENAREIWPRVIADPDTPWPIALALALKAQGRPAIVAGEVVGRRPTNHFSYDDARLMRTPRPIHGEEGFLSANLSAIEPACAPSLRDRAIQID